MHASTLRTLGVAAATAVAFGGVVASAPASAAASYDCQALKQAVYKTVNPYHGSQLLTGSLGESQASTSKYGFSEVRGVLGLGSATAAPGMVPVTRMYNSKTVDFLWVKSNSEIEAAKAFGYRTQAVNFYAPTTPSTCTVGVHKFAKNTHRRNAWTAADQKTLLAQGWTDVGVSFYLKPTTSDAPIAAATPIATPPTSTPTATPKPTATPTPTATAPAPGDDTFSVAVIGDTQGETTLTDPRFANRTTWLAAHKNALDIRYTLNTGDVTNWGWLTTSQYTVAKAALAKLSAAGMPYSVTVGNHDTEAVGWDGIAGSTKYGGAAYASNTECPTKLSIAQCKSWLLIRKTKEVNAAFPLSNLTNLGGVFESGKIDNNWTSFTANNTKWMVLTLELWPRPAAVDWAKTVVASHPDYNVIIETHHYLNGDATISTSDGGYGATSPKYLYDTIVSKYKNVKIVTSGHTGGYANRTDKPNGNTVLSFLGNDLGRTNNPVRILTINTTTGVVTSTIHNPINNTTKGTTTGTITISR